MESLGLPQFDKYYNLVVPKRHRDAKLELVDPTVQPIIVSAIKSLETGQPRGLLLMGDVGCGKTSILAIVFRERLKQVIKRFDIPEYFPIGPYIDIKWITHAEIISLLRESIMEAENSRPTIPTSLDRRILLLDDLGRGYDDKSGWNLSLQEEYFDCRWRESLPTFITTNLTPEDLRSWQEWDRIIDRIADPDWITPVVVPGGSRRKN